MGGYVILFINTEIYGSSLYLVKGFVEVKKIACSINPTGYLKKENRSKWQEFSV
jgi:hypothetical protein